MHSKQNETEPAPTSPVTPTIRLAQKRPGTLSVRWLKLLNSNLSTIFRKSCPLLWRLSSRPPMPSDCGLLSGEIERNPTCVWYGLELGTPERTRGWWHSLRRVEEWLMLSHSHSGLPCYHCTTQALGKRFCWMNPFGSSPEISIPAPLPCSRRSQPGSAIRSLWYRTVLIWWTVLTACFVWRRRGE
jgi:hypothetical protein